MEYEELKNFMFSNLDVDIQSLESIIPQNYIIPNNKLANELTKDFPLDKEVELKVSKKGGKGEKEICSYASIKYETDNLSITNKQHFTPYDRVVHNAICSLFEAGNSMFTVDMVYRAMNGLTKSEKVSPQAISMVTSSIEKSRYIKATIDFTQEAKDRKSLVDIKETYLSDMLLSVKEIVVTTGGTTKRAYVFNSKPILYCYSQQVGQVISVPIKLLETKGAVRSTDEVIILREYLLRRIEGMKCKNMLFSSKILYESIYDQLQLTNPTKEKAHATRNHVKTILGYWKESKYIDAFEEYKDGKTYKGISITY